MTEMSGIEPKSQERDVDSSPRADRSWQKSAFPDGKSRHAARPSQVRVVALLIIDTTSTSFPNLRRPINAVAIYIRCAALLAKSALVAGFDITIMTNDAATIEVAFAQLGVPKQVAISQRDFISRLDPSVPHRSAHHKLDLLRDLASGDTEQYSMIVDLDAVFLRGLRSGELPAANQIGCYDISTMMASESHGRSVDDIRALTDEAVADPRWFGGELIIARGAMFGALVAILEEVEERYWTLRSSLYHTGDETPVSSALNLYLARGGSIMDAGARNIILRWWTARRSFPQPRFNAGLDRALLHLPADKEFLASQAGRPFDARSFLEAYRRYARRKLLMTRAKVALSNMVGGKTDQFVAYI
jgi:hypothetical protein